MASENPNQKPSFHQESNPGSRNLSSSSSSSNLYPTIDMRDVENLFPDTPQYAAGHHEDHRDAHSPSAPPLATEEVILKIPGAILHLIDRSYSVELACGDFEVLTLIQGENVVAVLARVANEIQWPLVKDETSVKLDDSHYFFSIRPPKAWHSGDAEGDLRNKTNNGSSADQDLLNYGLTFASKGQEGLLRELDRILERYTCFSFQKVADNREEVLEGAAEVAKETSPADLGSDKKRQVMEDRCTAYWTTLAPNVEEYSGTAAKLIASGSGKMIKGILWCGDVTAERLKWGNDVLKKRMNPGEKEAVISPETLKRIKRVKKVTQRTEKVANGVLSGVVKFSGFFSRSVANSKTGKKVLHLLPEEIILASLDGFDKICDAVEVAGKNVMSTSSTVTTELVSHRYGEKAGEATQEGLDAAGHAVGVAWAGFKIRRALNLKSALKPSQLTKSSIKAAVAEKMGKGEKTGKSGK